MAQPVEHRLMVSAPVLISCGPEIEPCVRFHTQESARMFSLSQINK